MLVGAMGWEFWLSSYSYVQHARVSRSLGLRDCLFFPLMNPMLVFSGHRDRTVEGPHQFMIGLGRVLLGYASIGSGLLVQRLTMPLLAPQGWLPSIVFLVSQYAAHSGRASRDIGLLRMLGYAIPER